MIFLRLALASLSSRKGSVALTILAISVSVFVVLGVEQIRQQAKHSFNNTISGIDLIVGPPTGDINLLLYSVFRMGNATNNIDWQSYQAIAQDDRVAWAVPISLGDSHKGYPVLGTTKPYFEQFRYGNNQPLALAQGQPFNDLYDVVLGSEVAHKLGYKLAEPLVLAHGLASTSFSLHTDSPFKVVGILKPTGTPVDQTLHVSLAGIDAIHDGWQPGLPRAITQPTTEPKAPTSITAIFVGLKSKLSTFAIQREINNNTRDPLLAILPGVTLSQLWEMMAVMENTLRLTSLLVLLASLLGLSAMLLASIRERRREITVLRAIGAAPWLILLLIEAEALLITLGGCLAALFGLGITLALAEDLLAEKVGLFISPNLFTGPNITLLAIVLLSAAVIALIPGLIAYQRAARIQFH